MGNKHAIAARVAALCDDLPPNVPLVDLFAGMCSVAGAMSVVGRPVITNDVQSYAALAARCLVTSGSGPPGAAEATQILKPLARTNADLLTDRFAAHLGREEAVLAKPSVDTYVAEVSRWRHAGNSRSVSSEVAGLRDSPQTMPYRLATLAFAWGYFGLRQAVDLDSVRYAIDQASAAGWSVERCEWARLALLQTASRISSSPGHFAQFLRGDTPRSLSRVLAARRRSVWHSFLQDLEALRPFGTHRWRRTNSALHGEARAAVRRLAGGQRIVFYADPPYTKEHYSRYYHVLETLERYDYPPSEGLGRYRPDRYRSDFALKRKVIPAFHELCNEISSRQGILLLSYPSSGVLTAQLGVDPAELLAAHFRAVSRVLAVPTSHSTLGARHGRRSRRVIEYVWRAE